MRRSNVVVVAAALRLLSVVVAKMVGRGISISTLYSNRLLVFLRWTNVDSFSVGQCHIDDLNAVRVDCQIHSNAAGRPNTRVGIEWRGDGLVFCLR